MKNIFVGFACLMMHLNPLAVLAIRNAYDLGVNFDINNPSILTLFFRALIYINLGY